MGATKKSGKNFTLSVAKFGMLTSKKPSQIIIIDCTNKTQSLNSFKIQDKGFYLYFSSLIESLFFVMLQKLSKLS